jgi:Ca2+-transporting ATPase
MVLGLPLPITAAQILWINLVDDGLPDFALTLEPKPADLMRRTPAGHKRVLLDREIKLLIGLISAVTGVLALTVFLAYFKYTGDIVLARTVAFTMLGVDSLLYVFSCKSLRQPLWEENIFDNKWLIGAVLVGLSFQLMAIYLPGLQKILRTVALGVNEWLVILGTSIIVISMIEGVKWAFNHIAKERE